MRINNKRMERFHMRVNSFTYQPYAVEREVFQPERSLRPVLGKRVLTPKSMQLIAEFRSKKDISDFLAELLNHEENMIDIEDGFKYRCYLSKEADASCYLIRRKTISLSQVIGKQNVCMK